MKVLPRIVGIFAIVGGVVMIIAGVATYFLVQEELKDEKITVSSDADNFAGDPVDGPFTAYAEAEVIQKHALEASGGLTYAQLDQDDPKRATVQNASFLRASLFTSVVAFGVAVLVVGLGLLFILVGLALLALDGRVRRLVTASPAAAPAYAYSAAPAVAAPAAPADVTAWPEPATVPADTVPASPPEAMPTTPTTPTTPADSGPIEPADSGPAAPSETPSTTPPDPRPSTSPEPPPST
jgi:hypothetical protein